ncbi:MAG: hypothetical protein M1816_005058 [Peltula sp. TS41687]|nr:MAG: hypothetical protein M1816_005058 [Peltula sp. TS41687]
MSPTETISQPPVSPSRPQTPPSSPKQSPKLMISAEGFQQAFETTMKKLLAPLPTSNKPVEIEDSKPEEKKSRVRAWDSVAYNYKLVKSTLSSPDDDEWEEYLFIERHKRNRDFSVFLDIKSECLRDILREVLKDVRGTSLREDKPTVSCLLRSGTLL